MAGTIEIRDTTQESPGGPPVLAVTLADLLDCFEPEARELTWAMLSFEAVGDLSYGKRMLDLEDRIAASPHGLVIAWAELHALARELHQVINGLIVGVQGRSALARLRRGTDVCAVSELVVESIDSSLWSVYARDDRVLQRLARRFHAAKVLVPTEHHA